MVAENELKEFKKAGGKTIIDPTTVDLGRDVRALRDLSRLLDLNIITTTGHYKESYSADLVKDASMEDLYREMMKEIQDGIGDTGIRPGLIGELGSGEDITPLEERGLVAAVKVQKETGLPIMVHFEPWLPGFYEVFQKIIALLTKNRAILDKVCICHLSHTFFDFSYYKKIMDTGVDIGFDDIGEACMGPEYAPSDVHKVDWLVQLVRDGHQKKILLGHDICGKTRLHTYGGFGYDHILSTIVPVLRKKGVPNDAIDDLLVRNPAELLDVK